jgi:hypothetical protein
LELLANAEETQQLAFGLQWTSIVSSGGKDAASKLAKQRGASHFVFRNQQVGFGYIDTKKNPLKAGVPVYPAALVAAIQYGGDALFAVKIGEGEYWLAEIRNDQPTSLDRFIFAENDATILAEAEQIVTAATSQDFSYQIYTNLVAHNFASARSTSAEDLFLAAMSESAKLEVLPKATSINFPKPVWVAIAVGGVVLAAHQAWQWKERNDAQQRAELAAQTSDLPPEQAWQQAMAAWQATRAAPSPAGYQVARASLGQVPVIWDGWYLEGASCKAGDVVAGQAPHRVWSCTATYERSKIGTFNTSMVNQIPRDWSVSFLPLNKMAVSWTLKQPVTNIDVTRFQTVQSHLVQTVSKLQELTSAFSAAPQIAFTPLDVPAPKKASDGTAYPPDPAVSALVKSSVVIKAPLRSVDRAAASDLPIDYTSVSLTAKRTLGLSESVTDQLSKSAIDAEVTGVLYAKTR